MTIANVEKLKQQGLLVNLGKYMDHAFLCQLARIKVNPDIIYNVSDDFQIVYTSFHRTTGNITIGLD